MELKECTAASSSFRSTSTIESQVGIIASFVEERLKMWSKGRAEKNISSFCLLQRILVSSG